MVLDIRAYTWLAQGLSWAYVVERLINAFDDMGHNTHIVSTNGINEQAFSENKMTKSIIGLQKFGPGKKAIDIDFCYTVPINFPKRFLANSKHKCAIYNYETTLWPKDWKRYYHLVDYYFPSSNFSAEVFYNNGIPPEKTFVIPHGVDKKVFNKDIKPIKLKTKKKFKFVAVVAPHFRKNIPALLEAYCQAFTKDDDVCLVLKTKSYKHSDGMYHMQKNPSGRKGFEIILGDVFRDIYKKYGNNIPEIELLNGHVENVSSIYNVCNCHISTTGSEGWGMPFIESMACGLLNIAPRYSGHLHFMNDDNSLLIDTTIRYARNVEQYWTFNPKSKIGEGKIGHTVDLMRKAYKEYDQLIEKFTPSMNEVVDRFSWEYAAQLIIDSVEGRNPHYVPGTYGLPK